MADKGSQEELTLRRMPDGGYLVLSRNSRALDSMFMFASSGISGALDYMRGQIEPIPERAEQ